MKTVALTAVLSALSLTAAHPNRIHDGARHLEERRHLAHYANSTAPDHPSGTASPTQHIHARHFSHPYPSSGSLVLRHHIPTEVEPAATGLFARHHGTGVSKRHLQESTVTPVPTPTSLVARSRTILVERTPLTLEVDDAPTAISTRTTTETISGVVKNGTFTSTVA